MFCLSCKFELLATLDSRCQTSSRGVADRAGPAGRVPFQIVHHGQSKGKGKPGKGQNAPFSDAALEQRYQKLLRDRWAAGKDTISRARYARQLGHTGGNREPPSNLPNLHRSVEAPRAKPKATPKVQRTPPPPPPKRRKSDPDASRPSEPAPASQVAQVEETSPAPVQAPQVLVPEPQAAQPDTTQPMAGAGGDAPVPPSPAPVEGPTLEPAQASNLDSSSIQAAQSKAPEEAPPGTTAKTVETAQAEESSPAAKVSTEEVPLPSAQVEEASPTKAEPPSFLPFEFPDSSAPSLPHSEASPAQAKSATGEAEAPAHTSARSLLSSSTDDSDTLEPVASPQDEESSPELKRELPEISSAQDPEDLSALYKEFLATPKVLSGEVKHHKGTANSPWTCYLPSSLTDEEGRVWYVFGVGGDRATLAPPASLGRAHAHQVLKIGRPDSMTPERKYFALLHRDFNYVTRPAGYGTTTVADNARTPTQGFVLECECVYYQKVAPARWTWSGSSRTSKRACCKACHSSARASSEPTKRSSRTAGDMAKICGRGSRTHLRCRARRRLDLDLDGKLSKM